MYREHIRLSISTHHPDMLVLGEAETGAEFFGLLSNGIPDIVLLDIALPDMSGIDIARRLKREHPDVKILVFSAENSAQTIKSMLDIGVNGFVGKRLGSGAVISEAIYSVMQGVDFYGADISEIIYRIYVSKKKTLKATSEFTEQEKRVIELSCDGQFGKEVAARLDVNLRTVDTHKRNIFKKLGINTTVEMVNYAMKTGIIKVND
jgi:DNA-binding NarL/FixJ family response regulator